MKMTKKIGLVFCAMLAMIGAGSITASAKKIKTVKNPEVITEGKLTRTIKVPNKDFELKVQYGLAGVVFDNYATPLSIEITSKSDFTGSIRVVPATDYGTGIIARGETISLAKGTTKTIQFDQDTQDDRGYYWIQILDEKEEIIYAEQDNTFTEWADQKYYIATLCDDFSGLAYFDGLNVNLTNSTDTSLVELNETSFPEKSRYLRPINCIIMNNYDSSKLSEAQYNSLKQWVASGGNLIIGLGANAKNTLQCFQDDFIEGTFGDVSKKDLEIIGIKNVDVVDFQLTDGEALSDLFADQVVQYKNVGSGKVVVLGFDLTMEPLASAPDKTTLSNALMIWLSNNNPNSLMNNPTSGYSYSSDFVDVAGMVNQTPTPSTLLYGALFFIYSVLVGPVLYLVLRKKNKRESIWVAIPITSFVFTLMVCAISSVNRVKKPIVSSVSVITVSDGVKTEDTFFNLLCPKPKKYSFMLNKDYEDVQTPRQSYYNSSLFGNGTQNVEEGDYSLLLEKTNDGKRMDFNNSEAFTSQNLSVQRNVSNDIGTFDVKLNCLTDGFEGTITNNTQYDLTNLIVYFDQRFAYVKSIAKGETVGIAKDEVRDGSGYDPFMKIYENHTMFGKDKSEVARAVSMAMLQEYVNKQNYGVAYVWANVGTYNPEIIRGNKTKQYGMAVVLQEQQVDYYNNDEGYCPNISVLATSCDGDIDLNEGRMYEDVGNVTYVFDGYTKITELLNQNYSKELANNDLDSNVTYASVYAYNTETGEYDPIFVDSASLSGEELQKYLAGNVMILRYQKGPDYNTVIPRISLQGEY